MTKRSSKGGNNHIDPDSFETGAGLDVFNGVNADAYSQMEGRTLGDYRITGLIAEGGMGRVFRAERIDGSFDRDVAIKLSPGSGLNTSLRERFLREQDILAGLNHPNITQLYDAGVTEEGWPYLVMELIDGQPIDTYVLANGLSHGQIVDLMIRIADAVAFAHARLIVHRDIKPSNVMVTADGRPKLLDFGIAKPLDPELTALTQALPMTPQSASPEQLLGKPITVGSDIYQLGLLMFRLLTGRSLRCATKVSDAIKDAAEARSVSLDAEARRLVPGELKQIIEKCLRFDVEERYWGVDALRNDLKAYRDGYPVQAAGPSGVYRLRKMLARNRATTLTAVVALLTIVGGASVYTWQLAESRDDARLAAERAEEITGFLVGLFERANPDRGGRRDLLARDLLDEALPQLDELDSQPVTRAALTQTISHVYRELGRLDRAEELLRSSYETQLEYLEDDDPEVIESLYALGIMSFDRGNYADALEHYEEARTRLLRTKSETDEAMIRPLHLIANAHARLGNIETARELMTDSVDLRRRYEGPHSKRIAQGLQTLGVLAMWQGDADESERINREALEHYEKSDSTHTPSYAGTLDNLGRLLVDTGRPEEGLEYHERAAVIWEALFGPDHREMAESLNRIGIVYDRLGDHATAIDYLERSIATFERANDPPNHNIMSPLLMIAQVYGDEGEHRKAIDFAERGIQHMLRAYDPTHWRAGFAYTDTGRYYAHVGEAERAKSTIERGLEIIRKSDVAGSIQEAWGIANLADYYQTIGDSEKALAANQEALELARTAAPSSELIAELETRVEALSDESM